MSKNTFGKRIMGKRIQELRKEKKLTQKELAEMIHVSEKYISNIETGNGSNCSLPVFVSIVNALDTSADYLLGAVINTPKKNDTVEYVSEELKTMGDKQIKCITEIIHALKSMDLEE